MEKIKNHDISILGEFVEKTLEKEFFNYDMSRHAKSVGPIAIIFGIIYSIFIISDYIDIKNPLAFRTILIVRVSFLILSIFTYVAVRKINNYTHLSYLITAYEISAILGFFVIVQQYESLSILLYFSLVIITLAIYITPNKLINSQFLSIFLGSSFFIFHANRIIGINPLMFYRLIAYYIIIVIYCNIGAYLNNLYKRRQFIDSKEIKRLSITDPMTGIYNRLKFNDELEQWIQHSNKNASPLTLVMIDIDDFKRVNDRYGHHTGDRIIQSVVAKIKDTIRVTDIFARWGGEEFVIILPNTDELQALEIIERLRFSIENDKLEIDEKITCSFGLVGLINNEDSDSLLQRADSLLYRAKESGKNVVIWDGMWTKDRDSFSAEII